METELLQRIERLERQNRRMKLAGGALVLGLVAVLVVGQAKPAVTDVVEANKFVIKDRTGKFRGELSADQKWPWLKLENDDGFVTLSCADHNSTLALRKGAHMATLDADALFLSYTGAPRACVQVSEDVAEFAVTDREMKTRASLKLDGSAQSDASKAKASLSVSGPLTFAPSGKNGWQASVVVGHDAVTVQDRDSAPRAVLGRTALQSTTTGSEELTGPSSLVLFDKDGKVVFREPR